MCLRTQSSLETFSSDFGHGVFVWVLRELCACLALCHTHTHRACSAVGAAVGALSGSHAFLASCVCVGLLPVLCLHLMCVCACTICRTARTRGACGGAPLWSPTGSAPLPSGKRCSTLTPSARCVYITGGGAGRYGGDFFKAQKGGHMGHGAAWGPPARGDKREQRHGTRCECTQCE